MDGQPGIDVTVGVVGEHVAADAVVCVAFEAPRGSAAGGVATDSVVDEQAATGLAPDAVDRVAVHEVPGHYGPSPDGDSISDVSGHDGACDHDVQGAFGKNA